MGVGGRNHLPPAVDLFDTLYIRLCNEFGLQEPVYENNGDFRVTIMRPGKESDNQASGGVATTNPTTTSEDPSTNLWNLLKNGPLSAKELMERMGLKDKKSFV